MLTSLLPFVLIFVIMYFLILRPQQKRVKQHAEMVKNVRKGDTVITSGGLVGRVTKVVDDDQIEVEVADGVRVRQMRSDGHRRARQGRAGQGRRQRELIAIGRTSSDALFLTMEGAGDAADGAHRVPVRRAEFLQRGDGRRAGRPGRSATWCSGSTCRAARTSCSKSTPTTCARKRPNSCATTCAACCARRASAIPVSWCAG